MDKLSLNLRQRKLLYMLQDQTEYTTGQFLAKELNVSPRTIRNDIVEINDALKPFHAEIFSERSKGYLFRANNKEEIRQLNRIDTAFLTKEDRIRYLAFLLCLAETPINLFDLEDEIFISHTTLINDVAQLKRMYGRNFPYIKLINEKNEIYFEKDELKIRKLLLILFHADWDYNRAGNAYYGYEFLDRSVIAYIMKTVPEILQTFKIRMEDPALVALELMLAIVYHRALTGHLLLDFVPAVRPDRLSCDAAEALFQSIEEHFSTWFPDEEKLFVKDFIRSFQLPETLPAHKRTPENFRAYDPVSFALCQNIIAAIYRTFSLDLSEDMDFFMTMQIYFVLLKRDGIIFNTQGNKDYAKEMLSTELEIAYCIQPLAQEYIGRYMNEQELLQLAQCISGAFEYQFAIHPEKKLKALICSHTNMPSTWALKTKVLSAFSNYLDITGLIPVSERYAHRLDRLDVILTTVNKTVSETTDTLKISPLMTSSDYTTISEYIRDKRMEILCRHTQKDCIALLKNASWHYDFEAKDILSVLGSIRNDFVYNMYAPDVYMMDILRRESVCSFATRPGIIFVHSLIPAAETRLSVTILKHRLVWNGYKVRLVIAGLFSPSDMNLIFQIKSLVAQTDIGFDTLVQCRTKEDVLELLRHTE